MQDFEFIAHSLGKMVLLNLDLLTKSMQMLINSDKFINDW